MKWYFRYGRTIMFTGTKEEMDKIMVTVYKNCRKYYNIASEQQIKQESWEF